MLKRLLFILLILPVPLAAQGSDDERFFELMRLDEMVQVIREEGLITDAFLPDEMMLGQGGAAWDAELVQIYNTENMINTVRAGIARSLGATDLSGMITYLESPTWQEAVDLELMARTAMLDPDVEAAAYETYYDTYLKKSHRMRDLEELVDTADLIESNVVGALNGMLQFNLGLMAAGVDIGFSEDELLTQIWADEEFFRQDVTEWLFAFLLLAYDPMERSMLRDQIAYFATDEGQRLNRAMMDGFDALFDDISFQLGVAIGEMMEERVL